MQKPSRCLLLGVLAALSLLFSACERNTASAATAAITNPFVGRWVSFHIEDPKNDGPSVGWEIVFSADGRFTHLSDSGHHFKNLREGSYTYESGVLSLAYTDRGSPWQPTYEFRDDTLRITTPQATQWFVDLRQSIEPHAALAQLREIPRSVDEAVTALKTIISAEDLAEIGRQKKDELALYHFGLGMYIRNTFGLWSGNKELREACGEGIHPDDASGVIIRALWESLQEPQPQTQPQ